MAIEKGRDPSIERRFDLGSKEIRADEVLPVVEDDAGFVSLLRYGKETRDRYIRARESLDDPETLMLIKSHSILESTLTKIIAATYRNYPKGRSDRYGEVNKKIELIEFFYGDRFPYSAKVAALNRLRNEAAHGRDPVKYGNLKRDFESKFNEEDLQPGQTSLARLESCLIRLQVQLIVFAHLIEEGVGPDLRQTVERIEIQPC